MNGILLLEVDIAAESSEDLDKGLAQVIESVDKEVRIERYIYQTYGIRLTNTDFERIFDIIHE